MFFWVGGDDVWYGVVWYVNEGVDQGQENVGYVGVDDFVLCGEVWCVEGQYVDDVEWDGFLQQERVELVVLCVGVVYQQFYQWVGDGVEYVGD